MWKISNGHALSWSWKDNCTEIIQLPHSSILKFVPNLYGSILLYEKLLTSIQTVDGLPKMNEGDISVYVQKLMSILDLFDCYLVEEQLSLIT